MRERVEFTHERGGGHAQVVYHVSFQLAHTTFNTSCSRVVHTETYQFGNTGSSTCRVLLHGSNQFMSRPTSAQNFSGLSLAAAKTRLYAASDACFLQHCVGKCDLKLPDASPAFRFAAAQRVQANLPSVFFRRTGAQLFRRWTECFTLRSIVAGGVFWTSTLLSRVPLVFVCSFGARF